MDADGVAEFLMVAEAGSFTAAAKTLGVSVAHVSRQVARLENRIQAKLFQRSTRSLSLTREGEIFDERCRSIADDLEAAILQVRGAQSGLEGRLRIASLAGSYADTVVGPAMAELSAQHPNLEIEVDFNPRMVDIRREGFDLAIRSGPLEDSDLIARPLAARSRAAAAAPAYLEEYGVPKVPRDLVHHQCLHTSENAWRFQIDGKVQHIRTKGRLRMNSGPALVASCEKGLGIAYMARGLFGSALTDGRLLPVLEAYWLTDTDISLIYADRHFLPARITAAIECLEKQAALAESDNVLTA